MSKNSLKQGKGRISKIAKDSSQNSEAWTELLCAVLVSVAFDSIILHNVSLSETFYFACNELNKTEQIITEYRIKAKQLHPDKNQEAVAACTEEFAKLQVAKDVLTDPKMRKEYDTWRASGMAMCFEKWLAMRRSLKTSMHWAVPTNKTPMIKLNTETEPTGTSSCCGHGPESFSEILKKFRNHEI